MKKSLRYLLGVAAMFMLLTIGSCNLPKPDGIGWGGLGGGKPAGPTNTDGAETILIPGGTFWMGSETTEVDADDDEMPRHQVTLDGFYIYTHEVTNEMYAACVVAGGCLPVRTLESGPTSHHDDPTYVENPISGVDWLMARDYCVWAGGRLPTEAEWELAARGTESLRYPWGEEDPGCDRVNMIGCIVPPDTVEVGSYEWGNSPYDVWDMAGNVWEWVNDWYDEDYYHLSASSNPIGPYYGELKAARGGGLYSGPVQMRTAARVGANPHRGYDDVGFRCVPEAEDLPSGYYPPDERHEWTDPDPLDGSGEHLEDPGDDIPWYSIGGSWATCPSDEGLMEMLIEADSSEEVEYSVVVNGNPFDCYYDELFRGLQCIGPIPANNDELDYYTVDVHYDTGDTVRTYPRRPLDCEGTVPMWGGHAWASCPADGWVTVTFESDPPVPWEITQLELGGAYVDMPCWGVGGGRTNCIVPERAPGDDYHFYLRGPGSDGRIYNWYTAAVIPADCPTGVRNTAVTSDCGEPGPVAQVMYDPASAHLGSVSTLGVPLPCIGMAPGVQVCGPLPGDAGSPITITTCFEGEACTDWPLNVADCTAATEPGHFIDIVCYPPGATGVSIRYWPFDSPLVSVDAGGADLTCEDRGGGTYMCPGLTFAPGGSTTVTVCLADGTCFSETDAIPSCSEEPSSGSWRVAALGCHDETRIFFIVDTYLEWLVPGVAFGYRANDGDTDYSCSVHPTIPGRLYCAGARPETPRELEVCVRLGGGPLTCNYFDDFPGWVTGIPPCEEEEPPPHTGPACSAYTDQGTCLANGCIWDKGPPDGNEHCYDSPGP